MLRSTMITAVAALAGAMIQTPAAAQAGPTHNDANHPDLHINPRWKECSFQLSSSLTQTAWKQFTREAGVVVYFRPLNDAKPMGKGAFEISLLQWKTGIDDHDDAWNDTFVHPDPEHWLFEGSGLAFPGLTGRVGVSDKTDIGVYFTKAPGANYGFYGAQVQQNIINDTKRHWAFSGRASFVSMYGPEDLDFTVFGTDLLVSYEKRLNSWASISPYAGISGYLAHSREKSSVVDVDDEAVFDGTSMIGAALNLSKARVSAEYASGPVNSFSLKVGFGR